MHENKLINSGDSRFILIQPVKTLRQKYKHWAFRTAVTCHASPNQHYTYVDWDVWLKHLTLGTKVQFIMVF